MDTERQELAAKYGLTPDAFLGKGMEAEVYACGPDSVLKIYNRSVSLPHLQRLQDFYGSLDRTLVPFALPEIRSIHAEGPCTVTIERRLPGSVLADLLPHLPSDQLDRWFELHVETVRELGRLSMPEGTSHYKLFDPHQLSRRADGDWHQFLRRYLDHQLVSLADFFERDVTDFGEKRQRMNGALEQPYRGPCRLIHGDIFPGNILVHPSGRVEALLDFGLFTMYGDPFFDLATSWVFFDMYDQLGANVRERLRAVLIARFGETALPQLYRYVLLYSLLSANTYAPDCSDGHYEWCVANLNRAEYWDAME